MAWNEPGGNRNNQDPWGGGNRGRKDGPPDLDEAIKKGMEKLNRLFGGKPSGGGGKGHLLLWASGRVGEQCRPLAGYSLLTTKRESHSIWF